MLSQSFNLSLGPVQLAIRQSFLQVLGRTFLLRLCGAVHTLQLLLERPGLLRQALFPAFHLLFQRRHLLDALADLIFRAARPVREFLQSRLQLFQLD